MNGRWIGLPLLDPEERPLAIAKSPQIRMITFALVGQEELDIKRLQGRLIESQRTFDIADSQNHVVEHCSLLQIAQIAEASSLPFAAQFVRPVLESGLSFQICQLLFRWRYALHRRQVLRRE